jgi:hypothetical protein
MPHQWAGKRKCDIYKCRANHQNDSTPQQKQPVTQFDHEAKALKVRTNPININTAQGINNVTNESHNPPERPKKQQGARSWTSIRANLDVIEEQRSRIMELQKQVDETKELKNNEEMLAQQQSTIIILEKANVELVEEQRKRMLEVEENLESAQSNFFNKAIIEEQATSISDLKAKVFEATPKKCFFMKQEENVIEMQKQLIFWRRR